MRHCSCPITFIRQTHEGLTLFLGGYDTGYDTLVYNKKGNSTDKHVIELESNTITINNFPLGKGYYEFYLQSSTEATPVFTTYITREKRLQLIDKIVSYVTDLTDATTVLSLAQRIYEAPNSMTKSLVDLYRKINKPQPDEISDLCKTISAFERYENSAAIYMNKVNIGGTKLDYKKGLRIIPSEAITSINLYKLENNDNVLVRTYKENDRFDYPFKEDTFYFIDLLSDAELAVELIHYEPDARGKSIMWTRTTNELKRIDRIAEKGLELSTGSASVSEEDIERIITDKKIENPNAFLPSPTVKQSMFHDGVLDITINDYDLLRKMGKPFYLSIREVDQVFEKDFVKRYQIDSESMTINSAEELIADEVVFYIEDEKHTVVSGVTRIDLADAMHFGEMKDYTTAKNATKISEYVERYLDKAKSAIDNPELFNIVSEIVYSEASDTDTTTEDIYHNLLIKSVVSQRILRYSSNMLFFTAAEWAQQKTIDDKFFKRKPVFINAEDTFTFPTSKEKYVLVIEKISAGNDMTASVNKQFIASSENTVAQVNVAHEDMYVIYAIHSKDYRRSGFILVNNINGREYFTGQIELEAKSHG
jgi:hypothetical protein